MKVGKVRLYLWMHRGMHPTIVEHSLLAACLDVGHLFLGTGTFITICLLVDSMISLPLLLRRTG